MDAHENLSKQIAVELGVAGCAISLMGSPVEASSLTAGDLEDWQVVLGWGPSLSAFASGGTIEHVRDDRTSAEPAMFDHYLRAAGVTSATAFPLLQERERLGAMTIYHSSRLPLTDANRTCAESAARFVTGSIGVDMIEWAMRRDLVTGDLDLATGHLMATSGLRDHDAAAIIRAHAYATGTPLREVCARIVAAGGGAELWRTGQSHA